MNVANLCIILIFLLNVYKNYIHNKKVVGYIVQKYQVKNKTPQFIDAQVERNET